MLADRRQFLAAAAVALFGAERGRAAETPTVRLRYRTTPERIARILPEPLDVAEDSIVEIEASADFVLLKVACRLADQPGLLAIRGWTPSERRLRVAREALSLPVFPGEIRMDPGGLRVIAEGASLLEAVWAEGSGEVAQRADPTFVLDFVAGSDWTAGAPAGSLLKIPAQPGESRGSSVTSLEFPEVSVDHPVAEFPIVELVSASISSGASHLPLTTETVQTMDVGQRLLPLRYGRPVTLEKPWRPPAWPAEDSALRLDDASLARYQERPDLTLRPVQLIELTMMCSRETHAGLLPPGCNPLGRPMLKFLGIRSDGGDWTRGPFEEAWLMAFTMVANRPAWYAVSHIVTPGGDEVLGRETFGYPTQRGDVRVTVTPGEFSLAVQRDGSELFSGDGMFRGFATGTTLLSLPVVALQADPRTGHGRLIFQDWHYQGRKSQVDPSTIRTRLGGSWSELEPIRTAAATVLDGGGVQRSPGEVLLELDDASPWLRRRNDGQLPWEPEAPSSSS